MVSPSRSVFLPLLSLTLLLTGCSSPSPEVVVYTALDREFSEPILRRFERESGIRVRAIYDVESTKTVGLTQRIIAERRRPRCDVFWNNEIVNTLRLKSDGLLEDYASPAAAAYPAEFRSRDGAWHGFAARARVLIVNTRLVAEGDEPTKIEQLTDPKWKGRVGIAKPLFGTTATHAVCLFASWGDDRAKAFFRGLKANGVQVLSGNKQVALSVAAGELAVGLTDTDDAISQVRDGRPVKIVYLDAESGGTGTLFIPNTLALVRGGPNPEHARRLIDYLLTPAVEKALAEGPSAQIPLHPQSDARVAVKTPRDISAMQVDWERAAQQWEGVRQFLNDEFLAP